MLYSSITLARSIRLSHDVVERRDKSNIHHLASLVCDPASKPVLRFLVVPLRHLDHDEPALMRHACSPSMLTVVRWKLNTDTICLTRAHAHHSRARPFTPSMLYAHRIRSNA